MVPGQFAVPLLIEKCFNVKLSVALKLLSSFCLLISAVGIFRLFKALIQREEGSGLDNTLTVAVSLAFLVFTIAQPFFWGNLYFYDGGGILMLAYCPWFIYMVIKYNKFNIYSALILLISGLFGFFLKSAFTSIFIGALLYVFLSQITWPFNSLKSFNYKKNFLSGIYLLAIVFIYLLIIKFSFLDKNRGISESSPGTRIEFRVLFFPIVAPILGLFSADFINRTYQWVIGSVFILPLYYLILKSNYITILYKLVLTSFVTVCFGFYIFVYLINVDVSYDLRHYRVISILLTPAVFLIFQRFRFARYFVYVVTVVYFVMNVTSFIEGLIAASKNKPTKFKVTGLNSEFPPDLLKKIDSLDNLPNGTKNIFYFQIYNPLIALEIKNNRVLFEDNFINFHFNNELRFGRTLYYGINSGQIYLVYPLKNFKRDSTRYFTRFEKYRKFENIYQTNGYAIFKAIASE